MHFAIDIDGQRIEAFPNAKAICPNCNSVVIAKCGELNIWHWAHENLKNCDSWKYEPKTKWHIEWQNNFPDRQTEVFLTKNGETHIADILTNTGVVIEIQNSSISTTEIEERERFYKKMIWVINTNEFKQNLILKKFSFDFEKEVFFHYINPKPDIENAAYAIKIPEDDYNGQIKAALKKCNYKKYFDFELDEDEEEYYEDECIWYTIRDSFSQTLEKEISNAFYSYLFDKKMIYSIDDFDNCETNFKWKSFRKTWLTSKSPKFLDLNNRFLLWIIKLHENGNGFGKIVSKRKFLLKYKK